MVEPNTALQCLIVERDAAVADDLKDQLGSVASVRVTQRWARVEPNPDVVIIGPGSTLAEALQEAELAHASGAKVICVTNVREAEARGRLFVAGVLRVIDAPVAGDELRAAVMAVAAGSRSEQAARPEGDPPRGIMVLVRGVVPQAGATTVSVAIRQAAAAYYGKAELLRADGTQPAAGARLEALDGIGTGGPTSTAPTRSVDLVADARQSSPVVVIDAGSSDSPAIADLQRDADLTFLVVPDDTAAARQASGLIAGLDESDRRRVLLVVNRVVDDGSSTTELVEIIGRPIDLELPHRGGASASSPAGAPSPFDAAIAQVVRVSLQGDIVHARRALSAPSLDSPPGGRGGDARPDMAPTREVELVADETSRHSQRRAIVVAAALLVAVTLGAGIYWAPAGSGTPATTAPNASEPPHSTPTAPPDLPTASPPQAIVTTTPRAEPTAPPSATPTPTSRPSATPAVRSPAPPTPTVSPTVVNRVRQPAQVARMVFRPTEPRCEDAPPTSVRAGVFRQSANGQLFLDMQDHTDVGSLAEDGTFDMAGVDPSQHWHGRLTGPSGTAVFEVVTGIGCTQTYAVEYTFVDP